MLTIKAEASPGDDLRETSMPDLVRLARATGCRVTLQANGIEFKAQPEDTVSGMQDAFDRLYLTSRVVATAIRRPIPRG